MEKNTNNKKRMIALVIVLLAVITVASTWFVREQVDEVGGDVVVSMYCNQALAEIASTDSNATKALAAARSFTFEVNGIAKSIQMDTFVNDGMNSTFALSGGEVANVSVSNDMINVIVNRDGITYATGCPLSLKGRQTGDSGKPKMTTGTKEGKKAAKPEESIEVMDEDGEVVDVIDEKDIFDVEPEDVDVEDRIIVDRPLPSEEPEESEDEVFEDKIFEDEILEVQQTEVVAEQPSIEEPKAEQVVEEPVVEELPEVIEETSVQAENHPVIEIENPTSQQIFDGEDEIW